MADHSSEWTHHTHKEAGRRDHPPTKVSFQAIGHVQQVTREETVGEVQRHKAVPLDLPGETAWLFPQGDSCKLENACWAYVWRLLWHTRVYDKNYVVGWLILRVCLIGQAATLQLRAGMPATREQILINKIVTMHAQHINSLQPLDSLSFPCPPPPSLNPHSPTNRTQSP